jgi:chromosome segregation ATPase
LGNLEGIENIEEKIAAASARIERRKHTESKLQQARLSLQSERKRLADARAILLREEKDVRGLETLTMASILYSLAGRKDEKIDKEKQEFLAAKLKYDQATFAVNVLEADVESMARELTKLGDPQRDLALGLRAKEQLLLSIDDSRAKELADLQEGTGRLKAWRQELQEAIAAGGHARRQLQDVIKSLESARSWGIWDMLGGGVLATGVKHLRIEDAKKQIHDLQQLLHKFNHELADLNEIGIKLSIGSFQTFADYFFDGLLIDWFVQSKINNSLERAKEQLNRVDGTLQALQEKLRDTESSLANLAARRNQLLTT